MTRARLLAETDGRELAHWEAFESIDPGGEARGDLWTAQVVAAVRDVLRFDGDPTNPVKLVPDFWAEPKKPRRAPGEPGRRKGGGKKGGGQKTLRDS